MIDPAILSDTIKLLKLAQRNYTYWVFEGYYCWACGSFSETCDEYITHSKECLILKIPHIIEKIEEPYYNEDEN